MDWIDLRSDTVTWPTAEMRQAMAEARVGDDVLGDDPTVIRLETASAERLGKEAGLYIASGTMGNLIAVMTHCQRGDEAILGDRAHTFLYEAGGMAALAGVQPHTIPVQPDGTLALDAVRAAVRGQNIHFPRTRLVMLENTQNAAGGMVVSKEYTDAVGEIARDNGLALHIDGARIFNAAAALNCDVSELTASADSVSFCLSKGLCAPVGSVLVGSRAFIDEARRARKMLGGGMRQVGVLAAAGLIALEKMTLRLAEDHATAHALAEGLSQVPMVICDPSRVQTNMVFFSLRAEARLNAPQLADRLKSHGILMLPGGERGFRAVTHYWITPDHVHKVIGAFREELA